MVPVEVNDAPHTLSYATPARTDRKARPIRAMFGGMFLVGTGALTLLVGFAMVAELSFSGDMETGFATAVCLFSAICLLAGLPLIYRGTRGAGIE